MSTVAPFTGNSKSVLPKSSAPIEVPPGFSSTFTQVLGYDVHSLITEKIDGRPQLVMIHGALASRRYLMPTAKVLAKDFQVYIPEMPGHGASSRPPKALKVAEQAVVLAEWFKHHDMEKVYVFANSYGCQVAAQLTATHPELVKRLVLTGPTTDSSARFVPVMAFRLWWDGFYEPKGANQQLHDDLSDMTLPIAFETAHQMVSDDIRPKLEQIKLRTLVLRGANDPLAPQKWLEYIATLLSDSRIAVIPNSPHCVNFASPVELAKIMVDFFAEV